MKLNKKFAKAVVLGGAAAATAVALSGCGSQYSDGDRVGTVTKFSNKGLVCKTWEGEMAMENFVSSTDSDGKSIMTNTFDFTVSDPAIVPQIQDALNKGERVDLHYDQKILNNPCTTSSGYFITKVTPLAPKPR